MPHCFMVCHRKEKQKVYAFQRSYREPPKAAARSMVCHTLITGCSLVTLHMVHPMLKVDDMLDMQTDIDGRCVNAGG